MTRPTRIQRARQAGSRHPRGTLHASRPSHFGNPFVSAAAFRVWLETGEVDWGQVHARMLDGPHMWVNTRIQHGQTGWFDGRRAWILEHLPEVRDAACVSCWCRLDQECHVDVLIDLAFRPRVLT